MLNKGGKTPIKINHPLRSHPDRFLDSFKTNQPLKKPAPPKAEKKPNRVASFITKEVKLLPEFRRRSSVKSKGFDGQLKYLFFVLEPHLNLYRTANRKAWLWTTDTCRILWKSRRGRLIIVQSLAIIVLFGAIAWPKINQLPQPATTLAEGGKDNLKKDSLGIRRYLPTAKDYVPIASFEAANIQANLPVYAWIAPWNASDQKNNISRFAGLSAFWLTVEENGFDLKQKGDMELFLDLKTSLDHADYPSYLSVSGNPNYVYQALINDDVQTKLIDNLLSNVEKWDFTGIDLDFEMLGEENRELFNIFVKNLTTKFHNRNLKVSITLETRIDNPPMDWETLGDLADELRIMLYDYHSRGTGQPGPISPIGWVKEKMEYASVTIPKEKLVVGLPNYGYDWVKDDSPDAKYAYKGQGLSFETAVQLAAEKSAQIYRATGNDDRGFDIGDAPHFSYTDENNLEHQVYFEDKISLANKIKLISQYQPKGIIFWNVGLGDTLYWQAVTDKQIEEAKSKLDDLMLEKEIPEIVK